MDYTWTPSDDDTRRLQWVLDKMREHFPRETWNYDAVIMAGLVALKDVVTAKEQDEKDGV